MSNVSGPMFDGQDVGFTLNTHGSMNAFHMQVALSVEIHAMPSRLLPGL